MRSVIVGGARTPIGRFLGGLAEVPATELGGVAIAGALQRSGLSGEQVDLVILGHVLAAGAGQNPARQAAVRGGVPMRVPATSVNKVCLSGIAAVALADQMIRLGEADVVVAGGMESMSLAPHLLPRSRTGFKYGPATLQDHLAYDGLWDTFTDQAMGELTESANCQALAVSREDSDAYALRSHRRAVAARSTSLAAEIVPVSVPQRKGPDRQVMLDEGVREDVSMAGLAALRPAFGAHGVITAGSSSPLSDGACALVVVSERAAERWGLEPWAAIGAYGQVAGPDSSLQLQPARAIEAALRRRHVAVDDVDLIEVNEAFAPVALASARALGLTPEQIDHRLNTDGGAIALGHPIGASGARLVLHLALAIGQGRARTTVAALCGGGGQGDALVLTAP